MKTIWGSAWGDAGPDFGPPDAAPIDYRQFPPIQDVELGASAADGSGAGAPAIGGAGATQTVTHAGSGLVFINTFGSGALASPAFQNAVIAAETYLEIHFTNSITINASFDLQALNKAFSGQNSFNLVTTNYQSLVNAFQAHATSPDDTAAVNKLGSMADPSGGQPFYVSNDEAELLGLPGWTSGGPDDTVILNNVYWN